LKNLEFNKETGTFTKREEINISNTKDIEEIRQALKIELAGIIRQVKGHKRRAEEIRSMLSILDENEKPVKLTPDSPVQK